MKDEGDQRTIYTKDVVVAQFTLEACETCGRPYAPRKYLDFVRRNSDQTMGVDVVRDLCSACARKAGAKHLVGEITV